MSDIRTPSQFGCEKKKTFEKNYGVDNIWKLRDYRTWWEQEMIRKYGTCCLSDLHGNRNSWGWITMNDDEKKKRIKLLNASYKNWYENLSEEEKTIIIEGRSHGLTCFSSSKPEKRIEYILNLQNIFNKPQFWINRKSYDFWLGNKLVLEVQGTYWHCDPRIYRENDIVKFGNEQYMVSEIWEKDNIKKENAEKYGFNVVYLWEIDLTIMSDDDILKFIQNENKKHKENTK